MATNNSNNNQFDNNSDGFDLSGGTTKRKLTVTGADVTLTGSGSNVYTMPASTTTLLGQSDLPSGSIWMFGGSTAPTGWLVCDGSAVSRTTYAALYSAIGTAYGSGNGSTTFNLPNLQGRFPLGAGTGSANNASVWTRGTQPTGTNTAGGDEHHTASISEMPSHNHTASDSGHSHTVNYHGSGAEASGYGLVGSAGFQNRVGVSTSGGDSSNTSWANITVASTGSTTPWSQMPPLSVVNFIIKS